MNRRISPLAIILLAGLLVAAFALSIVNLNVALPYAQWRQALRQPDSDQIAQMLVQPGIQPALWRRGRDGTLAEVRHGGGRDSGRGGCGAALQAALQVRADRLRPLLVLGARQQP